MTIDFGTDVLCSADTEDADALFTEVSGVALVRQDVRHRLLTGSVLGPGGAAWGFDLRTLLGATAAQAIVYQPRIKKAVLADQRVASVDVTVSSVARAGLAVLSVTVTARTALGPFSLVFVLDPSKPLADQIAVIEGQ